jgi:hypothetical protein
MATIRSLNVNLSMGVASFVKGAKTAKVSLKSISDTVFSLKGAIVGLGAAMAANAVVGWIGGAISEIDDLNDVATRLNTSIQNISELGYVAQLSGSSMETFTGALAKMSGVLGKSDEDTDKAATAFADLKLSAEELQAMDPTEAFYKIGEALAEMPNHYQQSAAAAKIFGRTAGPELLTMLTQGTEATEELRKEAQAFGVSITELGAAKIAMAADALDRVKAIWHGIGLTLAQEVAPYIVTISSGISDWAKSGNVIKFVKDMFKGFLTVLAKVLDVLESVISGIKKLKGAADWVSNTGSDIVNYAAGGIPGMVGGQVKRIAGAGTAAAPQSESQKILAGFDKVFADIEAKANAEAQKMVDDQKAKREDDKHDAAAAEWRKLHQEYDDMVAEVDKEIRKANQEIIEKQKEASKKVAESIRESLKTPTEKLRDELLKAKEAYQNGFLSSAEFEAMKKQKLDEAGEKSADILKSLEEPESTKLTFSTAIRKGSAEDRSSLNQLRGGSYESSPMKSLDKTQKEALKELQANTRAIKEINIPKLRGF